MKTAGIYAITNHQNGRAYIGSSRDVETRLRTHRRHLEAGSHENRRLQRDWDDCGSGAFSFEVVEVTVADDDATLDEAENRHIHVQAHPYNHGRAHRWADRGQPPVNVDALLRTAAMCQLIEESAELDVRLRRMETKVFGEPRGATFVEWLGHHAAPVVSIHTDEPSLLQRIRAYRVDWHQRMLRLSEAVGFTFEDFGREYIERLRP